MFGTLKVTQSIVKHALALTQPACPSRRKIGNACDFHLSCKSQFGLLRGSLYGRFKNRGALNLLRKQTFQFGSANIYIISSFNQSDNCIVSGFFIQPSKEVDNTINTIDACYHCYSLIRIRTQLSNKKIKGLIFEWQTRR